MAGLNFKSIILMLSVVLLPSAVSSQELPFGLVIGYNHSLDPEVSPLRYADDDAVQNAIMLREMGAEVVLLAELDVDTQTQFPRLTSVAPTWKRINQALKELNQRMDAARVNGHQPVLYLFYSGHGDVQNNRGYVNLKGEKLFRRQVMQLLTESRASRNHIIIDACKSYFLVFERGQKGKRSSVVAPLEAIAQFDDELPPNTGVFLSTSAATDSHEWEALQAGIFSYEMRSAMRGAADVNGDNRITYQEAAAFIWNANEEIVNPRFRPVFFSKPPDQIRESKPLLLDLNLFKGDRLHIQPEVARHWYLENASGQRLADFHPISQLKQILRIPVSRPMFVRTAGGEAEEREIPPGRDVYLAKLEPRRPKVRQRGAIHLAFRKLFFNPFGPRTMESYRQRPLEIESALPESNLDWLLWTVGAASLASLIAGGTMSALAYKEKASLEEFTSALKTHETNRRIQKYNQAAVGFYIASGVALASFLIWSFWPEEKEVVPFVSSRGDPGMVMLLRW